MPALLCCQNAVLIVALLQTEAKDKEMIVSLLDLRKRMSDIVEQSFGGARMFRDGVKEAFDSFINSRQNKPAEMLAKCLLPLIPYRSAVCNFCASGT